MGVQGTTLYVLLRDFHLTPSPLNIDWMVQVYIGFGFRVTLLVNIPVPRSVRARGQAAQQTLEGGGEIKNCALAPRVFLDKMLRVLKIPFDVTHVVRASHSSDTVCIIGLGRPTNSDT